MVAHADDAEITDERFLLRAMVQPRWIVDKGQGPRPASESLTDSNLENSCFIEGEITREEIIAFLTEEAKKHQNHGLLNQIERGLRFARFPVALVRRAGFFIERRPEEAIGCAHPQAHVVIGPPNVITRNQYEKAARTIVKDPATTII